MTEATMSALSKISAIEWSSAQETSLDDLVQALRRLPLHHSEFDMVMEAQQNYYAGQAVALEAIGNFATDFRVYYRLRTQTVHTEAEPQPVHLHSCIDIIADEEGAFLFPISLDVILDPVKGDLLADDVQTFWLRKVAEGLILVTVAGPPCETWSVSRWRQLEGDGGPRLVRSTEDLFSLIWSITLLPIRELRQTTVGNKLLQFALLMMAADAISDTIGLLEHPSAPDEKPTRVPASIWRLPIVQLMRKHPNVGLTHIKQGYFGARSPKPTTFMVKALCASQTTTKLPPALTMERNGTHQEGVLEYAFEAISSWSMYSTVQDDSLPSTSAWRMTPLTKEKMVMISVVE